MQNLIGVDTSFYEDNPDTTRGIDFTQLKKVAGFIIARAGQNTWLDVFFKRTWSEAKLAGLPRGSYWFYDNHSDPKTQAELYLSMHDGDLGELPFFADFEETPDGPFRGYANWLVFLERLKELAPGKEIGVYTGYYYWIENVPSAARDYFAQYPLWIATYGTSPLIPLPWMNYLFWQYTDSGDGGTYGMESKNVDLNYFNGDMVAFAQRFKIGTLPPAPPSSDVLLSERQYFSGAMFRSYQKYTSHGIAKYYVMEVNADQAEFFVSPNTRGYVPDLLLKYNLDFAVNGDGFDAVITAGFGSSQGMAYQPKGMEETIYISKDNLFSRTPPMNIWNAVSYPNRLVVDGVIVPINKAVDDIRARTAWGYTKDRKKVFFLWVDGADYWVKAGLNFHECAAILFDLGCDVGVMQDGGGSITAAVRENNTAVVLGRPWGEDFVSAYQQNMRRVANIIGVRMKGAALPPLPQTQGDITMATYIVNIAVRPRSIASVTTNDQGANIPAGTTFDSNVTQVDAVTASHPTMVQIPNGMWVPLIYNGVEYVKAIATPVPTPNPTPTPTDNVVEAELFLKDVNGNILEHFKGLIPKVN